MSPSVDDVARDWIDVSMDLRRALRRRIAATDPDDVLTLAESELLHDVAAHPATRVGDSAQRLGVAANTVSTLVRRLVDRGLLTRGADPDDARAAVLTVSDDRTLRRDRRADERIALVAERLQELGAADQQLLADALPVLLGVVRAIKDDTPDDGVPEAMADRPL